MSKSLFRASASIAMFVALLVAVPSASHAAADTNAELLAKLKAEVAKLQAGAGVKTVTVAPTTWEFFIESNGIPVGSETQEEEEFDEDELLEIFHAYNGKIADRDNLNNSIDVEDQFIWDLFKSIAGEKFVKKHLRFYATYRGANEPVLAYVQVLTHKSPGWVLAVNANASDLENRRWKRDMAITLVHEYAHILFLNNKQTDITKKNFGSCSKTKGWYLFYANGCTKKNSYAQAYYDTFWTNQEIDNAVDAHEAGETLGYYSEHESSFITEYAAKNHIEDMAESFTDFVLRGKPTGLSEKEEKTRFFYGYPELVKERERIRAALGQYF